MPPPEAPPVTWPTPEAEALRNRFDNAAREAFRGTEMRWNVSLAGPLPEGINLMLDLSPGVMLMLAVKPFAVQEMTNMRMRDVWLRLARTFVEQQEAQVTLR